MIGLITCFFNPTNSNKIRSNYSEFRKRLNHPIVTVELAFNGQPFFIDDSIKVRGSNKNILWQKERLLNIALKSLPSHIDKVAWLDADIIFENPNWIQDAEKALDEKPVIQLFEEVDDSGDNKLSTHTGFGFARNLVVTGIKSNSAIGLWRTSGMRGLAWAATRDVLAEGFFDLGIVGSGDSYHLIAWLNAWDDPHVHRLPPHLRKQFLIWAWKVSQKVRGNVGYIKGKVLHLHHGSLKARNYLNRQKILINHNFCPDTDIIKDNNDLWAFSGNKPDLEKDIKTYFEQRALDEQS